MAPSAVKRLDATGVPLLLARLVVGLYFMHSGIVKIFDPVEFLKQIRLYHMLPEDPALWLNSVAIVLPWFELFCGAALVLSGVWLVGAGFEYALAPHWTAKFEYDFLGLSDRTLPGFAGTRAFELERDIQQVKVGINFKF